MKCQKCHLITMAKKKNKKKKPSPGALWKLLPRQLLLPRPTATALLHLDVIRRTSYIPVSPGSLFAT